MTKRALSKKQRQRNTFYWLNCTTSHSPPIRFMKDVFSCDDVCVMFQIKSVKYNFVKPFSPHVESVNDKKREALVPNVSLHLTISLSASIINQSCNRLFLIYSMRISFFFALNVEQLHFEETRLCQFTVLYKIFSVVMK